MKKLLFVFSIMLAFTFQSNAQECHVEDTGVGFEISAGASVPMFDFGDYAEVGYNLRMGLIIPTKNQDINVVVGGMLNSNSVKVDDSFTNDFKLIEGGLDFKLNPSIRLKTLIVGGFYQLHHENAGKISQSGGLGFDIRLDIEINKNAFVSVNLMKLNLDGFEDFGMGFFGTSLGVKF